MGSLAGAALGVGSIVKGIFGSNAAGDAADAQAAAYARATELLQQYYTKGIGYLQPFISGGGDAYSNLLKMTGNDPGGDPSKAPLTRTFQPTMEELERTPGYQFALGQGLKEVKNNLAARGLAGSGETLAGATKFATGLASTTYQQQFDNYLKQNQQIFGMLKGMGDTGFTAADAAARLGMSAGGGQASAAIGAGNAQAAGDLASGAAFGNMFGSLGQLPYAYLGMQQYLNPTGNNGGGGQLGTLTGGTASIGRLPYNPLAGFGGIY